MLFPIARGGKAAVPGGFGSGKCVVPGTPVLLGDGSIKIIDEIFREAKGGKPDETLPEEVYELKEPLHVIGFDGTKLRPVKATHVYRGFTDRIIKVRTATGRVIEVTPEHKLPVFNSDGSISEVKAKNLEPGMFLVVPKVIRVNKAEATIGEKLLAELSRYNNIYSKDEDTNKEVKEILKELYRDSRELFNKVLKASGLAKETVKGIMYQANRSVPLKLILALRAIAGKEIKLPSRVAAAKSNKVVNVPHIITEELAELLGLVISDGAIVNNHVRFFNNDPSLRSRFLELMRTVFGVDGVEKSFRTVEGVEIHSSVVAKMLKALGIPARRKSRSCAVPPEVLSADESVVGAFIRGLFLGDGSMSGNTLEFTSASEKLITGVAYLLSRLGILYSVNLSNRKNRLFITGVDELRKFYSKVLAGVEITDKVRKVRTYIATHKSGRIAREVIPVDSSILRKIYLLISKRKLEGAGIHVGNQIYQGENITAPTIAKVLSLIPPDTEVAPQATVAIKYLRRILTLLNQVSLDRIESVEVEEKKTVVYDLVVPETHNFVGGKAPVIYHNTVLLQTLTKWARTQLNIYVGCGERGNEMSDALHSFLKLKDPKSGRPLAEKAVFIANTSNMPVAARETSVFLGVTIGEYFRDMGYDVLMVADSTSRWAEAMREISARLEEMPGEEGFPAYLGSRLAEFYERSGRVVCSGSPERNGSLTIVGAVSPPGADFSEPVTQNTLRYIGTLIALDIALANRRHFPAVSWLTSYSLYVETVERWWRNVFTDWLQVRNEALKILQRENELMEIVRLVGPDALPDDDKLLLDAARMIREDFLQQNAFHPVDAYSPPEKTVLMLKVILEFYSQATKALSSGVPLTKIRELPVRTKIARMKEVPGTEFRTHYENLMKEIKDEFSALIGGGA
ncbi:MAG: V-type ATP synthase subunit A [Desulfurococcales archaeon]|nr:V-type ATP synthase subunit A [Desulfurococcales archaeon]